MQKTLFAITLDEINNVAKQIINLSLNHRKYAFYGEMGIGKTTLIKALSLQLGVNEMVTSPTFSIINEYSIRNNDKIYHFDFYRIENESEAFDIGFEEYLYSGSYCFIEWPEKISNLLTEDFVNIKMTFEQNKRRIEVII